MIRVLVVVILFFYFNSVTANILSDTIRKNYDSAFIELNYSVKNDGLFKEAVYIVENTFFNNKLDREKFYRPIDDLRTLCLLWTNSNRITEYRFSDSLNLQKNFSIYSILKDTVKLIDEDSSVYSFVPFIYDFSDFNGSHNWSNMFVSKLLITRSGNCHSFPYLYKILADELKASCWLSLAPNHIYIKNRCKETGWYNTELTSGQFPIDAWITASGYIPLKAIQNGIYMDTLSNRQAIALCILDLAKGYEFQTRDYYDGFILKCCEVVLAYHPVNVQALLLKAETLKRLYEKQEKAKDYAAKNTYHEMEQVYIKLFELGYREMPEKMYLQWLAGLVTEKEKYSNKKLHATIKGTNTPAKKK
ncbi:hypothetical protein [Chitinophaga nivalis]|uniref:Protein SirB1 N-terminal domain-containing protein n=1 Tax=Chitinophaga nivalis TaxID=2991709 RepID=A0ABT3IP49_9BACT|nr:hypothetical protein [Chitinophaga nivalis]MCW3464810.1 hypothetical protein [Chitinophaga nivalis]MCW3485499.1 hypothetical protein [Chitinophaga nivalis]